MNSLQLFFVLLLSAAYVSAERGQSSFQRRRASIGHRPTPAPTSSGDDDDDIDSGGGKGKGAPAYYEFGKGKGNKKSKKSNHGKGNGKGKGNDGKGKGGKSEKKGAKKHKSYYHDGSTPAGQPSRSPPTPFEAGTASPTSVDSISSRSSPYSIKYSSITNVPNNNDYNQLTSVTQQFLEAEMVAFFDETALTDLDNFLTVRVREAFIEGEPALVVFESNGLFNPESIFIPVTREIDNLIENAIASDKYLEAINSLPSSNPFSETEGIVIVITEDQPTATSRSRTQKHSSSSYVGAGMAAAAAGIVVIAAALAVVRRRESFEDDEDESLSPGKASLDESTTTGETCIMSVDDTPGHFPHWRTMDAYNETDVNEFQDEPLDSDND